MMLNPGCCIPTILFLGVEGYRVEGNEIEVAINFIT